MTVTVMQSPCSPRKRRACGGKYSSAHRGGRHQVNVNQKGSGKLNEHLHGECAINTTKGKLRQADYLSRQSGVRDNGRFAGQVKPRAGNPFISPPPMGSLKTQLPELFVCRQALFAPIPEFVMLGTQPSHGRQLGGDPFALAVVRQETEGEGNRPCG